MDRQAFITIVGGSIVAGPLVAEAQQQTRNVPRIGVLVGGSGSSDAARIEAFRQGLRELGYVEGKNIVLEFRYADGNPDRLSELAATLVRLKVDVIVTAGPAATRAAKQATPATPIVMVQVNDPTDGGFVTSLARPGGTIRLPSARPARNMPTPGSYNRAQSSFLGESRLPPSLCTRRPARPAPRESARRGARRSRRRGGIGEGSGLL